MRILATAAAALAIALSAGIAYADDDSDANANTIQAIGSSTDTTFDLGVDVGGIAHSPAAIHTFLGSLAPDTRGILIKTCEHYMDTPYSTQTADTVAFCSVAVGG